MDRLVICDFMKRCYGRKDEMSVPGDAPRPDTLIASRRSECRSRCRALLQGDQIIFHPHYCPVKELMNSSKILHINMLQSTMSVTDLKFSTTYSVPHSGVKILEDEPRETVSRCVDCIYGLSLRIPDETGR